MNDPSPATVAITRLASGPVPPTANATRPNVLHTRVADVVKSMGAAPWSKRIIADERASSVATPTMARANGARERGQLDFRGRGER